MGPPNFLSRIKYDDIDFFFSLLNFLSVGGEDHRHSSQSTARAKLDKESGCTHRGIWRSVSVSE